ncbi:hypothetical protein PR003_g21414 [Phytophthora rubi]|uniref:Uncharacterized protein n=1 Tax=Phytophthora rubi TaxID=129364 RepID=A0A6A3JIG6_9STRA|nr:hypothetical protein PR002_g20862 [Phytophthora rubi]KAE8994749.1 hypothetical protein PR001_g20308 [Phytophthora rubi]KAE9305751.1 hypothetical protein PR003_g21414 [Phytophthora rubi]
MEPTTPTKKYGEDHKCAQCAEHVLKVKALECKRSQLVLSLRKSEMKADHLKQERAMLQRLQEAEMKTAERGDEVVTLLREAKTRAESREKQANADIQELKNKLDETVNRAEHAEKALLKEKEGYSSKEAEYRVEKASNELMTTRSMEVKVNLERDVETLKQELEEAKRDLQAANDRADGLLSLFQDTYSLASHVIAASHVLREKMTPCCDELGFLLGTFEGAGKNVSAAVQASQSGVRVVVHQRSDVTQVKFLCGTEKATSTEMMKHGYDGLVPFLHGANSLETKVQVAQAGKQLIKRKLEGEEKTEEAMYHWKPLFQEFTWTPSAAVVTRQEFLQCITDAVSANAEEALTEQLNRLSIMVTRELKDVHKKMAPAQEAHTGFAKMVKDWAIGWDGWTKKQKVLFAKVKAIRDGEIPERPTQTEEVAKMADTVQW